MDGYEGDFCERPIGCCISSLDCGLQNGNVPAVCIFETEFSFCGVCYYQCDKAFWLKSCNPSDKPKKFRCEEKECGANGTCAYDEKGIPFCQCDPGVIGENCEKPVSKCSPRNPNPLKCKRGGRCREDDNGAICQCQTGSTGPTCTEDAIPCGTSSCQNGGQCEQMIDGVYCACPPGFFGESCEEEIDPCEVRKEVCGHGKCITIAKGYDGQYKCECDNGWDPSTNCQTPVDPCVSSSCKAGSTCQPIDSTSYVCLCPDGMQGEKCDQQIDLCIQGVCLNGGTCKQYKDQDQTLQFRCDCPEGIHGDNCELLPDPCNAIHCQHNGYCVSTDSTAVCKCVDNYSGKFCEKPPSLCDEANYCNSGECIRADDGYDYCNCPPTFTGLRCETQKTDNYNFLFTGIQTKHKQTITSGALSDYSFNTAFTLCSWIKYGTDSNGNVKPKASASDESVVVRVDSSTDGTQWIPAALLTTSGITASGTRVIAHEMPWNEWHHVTIELDLQKRVLSLRIDGVVQQSHSVSDFDQSGSFRVVLGENMDGSQQFVGEISLVQVFDRLFTDDLYSEMVVDCPSFSNQQFPELVIPWTGYTTVDEYNDAVLSVYPGICVTSTCLPGRADCSADHDKVPPTVLNCPSTQHIVSNERLRVVTWPDDPQQMFKDNDMIVSVDSNFRSGQSFTWGVYHVVYVAKDRAGNIAICSFDIVVAPQDCSEPVSTNSVTVNMTTIADESQQIKELGVVSCSQDGFVFTQDRPPFYVCDLMGRWDRFANIGTRYNLPSCSSTVNPLQTLDGNMDIDSCDEVEKTRTQLRNAIIETGFCDSPDCDGQLEITDSCDRFRRFPRQVDSSFTSTTFIVYYQLNVTTTPYAVKPVLEEKFNATFGADAPNIDTRFDCYMDDHPQLHFSPHLHDTTKDKFQCASCPPGQYYDDEAKKCLLCPIDTYKKDEGGSTSLADCDVRCDPGSELDDSEQCVQCPTGTYRSDEMTVCRKCNRGFETQGPGAPASSSCNVVFCPAGHAEKAGIGAVNQDTASFDQVCELCDIGYYQPDEGSKACEKCPTGKTTAQRGSTSVDYCTVDGGLSCTPSHADQCPPGTECVQVDSGGYECRTLSTTTSPIRHPLPAWVWIVIVCVVMICILVVAFLSILYRERLLRYCDDHCPGLLRCWKLKEGGRRFSLNPTRDTTALPFTPNDLPANRTEEAARVPNESGAEVWSNLSSERASRWSGNRPHSLDYAHPDDPTALNNPEANALDEIRSGLIDVMESGSVESVASNHTTPPPAPPNHGLRVETRPPTFAALSQRRSLTRRQANGPFGRMDSAEMTTEAKFAAQINSSGRSFAWAHQRDSPTALRNKPGGQSTVAPYHPAGPTSQARPAFEDDDNDFFC
ncbi:Fibropellin-1 [Aphelenchoides fujianensis]|nr:Fibropellin-1 [Aphelenchoides fujianensis]